MELLQPKLINTVLDDHLLGVQTVWEKVDDGSVSYNGNKYEKVSKDDLDESSEVISILYLDGKYYVSSGMYSSSHVTEYDEETDELILNDGTRIQTTILSKDDLKKFYQPSISPIIQLLVIYGTLTIIIIIFRYFQHVFFLTASMRLTLDIRNDAFSKLNRLPMKYFISEPSGKVVTKITSDSEGVRGLYQVIFSILTAAISLIMVYVELFKDELDVIAF